MNIESANNDKSSNSPIKARVLKPIFSFWISSLFLLIHFLLFQDLKAALAATAMIPVTQFWLTPVQYSLQDSIG